MGGWFDIVRRLIFWRSASPPEVPTTHLQTGTWEYRTPKTGSWAPAATKTGTWENRTPQTGTWEDPSL